MKRTTHVCTLNRRRHLHIVHMLGNFQLLNFFLCITLLKGNISMYEQLEHSVQRSEDNIFNAIFVYDIFIIFIQIGKGTLQRHFC